MSTQERFSHLISLNREQEDVVYKARTLYKKNKLPTYTDLVLMGALAWIKDSLREAERK